MFTLTDSNIFNNSANIGGGLYLSKYPCEIKNTTFTKNNAQRGGAIYNNNITIRITSSNLIQNTALDSGVIYNLGRITLKIAF